MVTLTDVTRALKDVKGKNALCPAHKDTHRSLSFWAEPDGRIRLKCHRGCSFDAIVRALGWEPGDFLPERRAQITYDYVDEHGTLLYQAVRLVPKKFFCRRPDGRGKWVNNLDGVGRVLYRTPEVRAAIAAGRPVLIAEGEKDCDNLAHAGFTATTNANGAKHWRAEYAEQLRGARVVILPDNDDVGMAHGRTVAESLIGKAADVRVLILPDLPPKGDVSDWFAAGHTADELRALIDQAPEAAGFQWPNVATGVQQNPASRASVPGNDRRPTFLIRPELTGITDEALGALAERDDLGVYVRSHMLVTVVAESSMGRERKWLERAPDAPVIVPMTEPRLLAAIDQSSRWEKYDERAKRRRPAMPPSFLATQIMNRTGWPLRPLHGIIGAPTLRPDGSVLDRPGYDDATGLYYTPPADGGVWPGVKERPAKEDAQAAAKTLLAPFAEFPYKADSDYAACVAAILSLLCRHLIDGPVPLHRVGAPTGGTGKSLLVKGIGIIGCGREPDMMTLSNEDELRKRVTTLALEGTSAVVIDNASGALGSDLLAAILTRTTWEDRILGMSQQVSLPLVPVWFATGNNLAFKRTLARRALPIDLDAGMENPEDRSGFLYPDLVAHLKRHRLAYVAQALTIMRAFYCAGRPTHGKTPMGSFEAWDGTVRAAVIWAGLADPAASDSPDKGRGRIRSDADDDLESLATLLAELARAYPNSGEFTAADLIKLMERDEPLRLALSAGAGDEHGGVTAKSLPYALRGVARRPAGGLQLNDAANRHRPRRYYVAKNDGTMRTILPYFAGENGNGMKDKSGGTGGENRADRSIVPPEQNGHGEQGVITQTDGSQHFTPEKIAAMRADRLARLASQGGA